MRFVPLLVAAALIVSAGCASQKELLPDPVRNSELQRELNQEPFRGRWWNLYQRAFIYQEYELWERAETDIRAALGSRDLDQRWARTYGLHFIPEYFPNRELGIVLYQQERYAEATGYLATSIEHQYTARAAYYLDRARAANIAQSAPDTIAPDIEILRANDATILGSTQFDVQIVARDNTFVSTVAINGEVIPIRVSAREVSLVHPVTLQPGDNTIRVEAADLSGNRTRREIALRADTDGPTINFTTPIVLPGTIRGVAFDPSGVSSFSVGETTATLTRENDGSVRFELSVTDLAQTPVPQFRCVDALGNATAGVLPVDGVFSEAAAKEVAFASSQNLIALSDEIAAVYQGTELIGLIRTAQDDSAQDGPRIEFTNILDGQRYLKDEIVVGLDLRSSVSIAKVELNGHEVDGVIPGWTTQRVSRRIRLEDEGSHTITATLYDSSGDISTVQATIERRLPQVEAVSARLSVALLGDLSRTEDATLVEHAEFVRSEFPFALDREKRFNVIDRENIETVIDEQMLIAALGSVKDRRRLGQLEMADYMLIADLRKYADNIEILVHAIDSLTSRETIVDVFGPVSGIADLKELTRDLALRLEQEFPRVQGSLLRVSGGGGRVFSSLSEDDRVRKSMYCVIYRPREVIDPETQASLGTDLIPIAQGTLRDIQRQGSSIQLLLDDAGAGSERPVPTDYVITK